MITHHDRGRLQPPRKLGDSLLVVQGHAARAHLPPDALEYMNADGTTRREYRTLDEVAHIARMLDGVPVHAGHDPNYVIGRVLRAWVDDQHAGVELEIANPGAIEMIADFGVRELSLGYETEVTRDAEGRLWQHVVGVRELSVVPRGRCGGTCALAVDRHDCGPACGCRGKEDARATLDRLRSEMVQSRQWDWHKQRPRDSVLRGYRGEN